MNQGVPPCGSGASTPNPRRPVRHRRRARRECPARSGSDWPACAPRCSNRSPRTWSGLRRTRRSRSPERVDHPGKRRKAPRRTTPGRRPENRDESYRPGMRSRSKCSSVADVSTDRVTPRGTAALPRTPGSCFVVVMRSLLSEIVGYPNQVPQKVRWAAATSARPAA